MEQNCGPVMCVSYFVFKFYRHQNMKHCWGDTCGNLFNAGGDIESSARLTLNAGWFTQICVCVCSLKVQMVFPAPLHFHVGTKSHLCEGGAVWPSHITLALPEWGTRSDSNALSFLPLPSWHPWLSLNLHLCAPIIYLRCFISANEAQIQGMLSIGFW